MGGGEQSGAAKILKYIDIYLTRSRVLLNMYFFLNSESNQTIGKLIRLLVIDSYNTF